MAEQIENRVKTAEERVKNLLHPEKKLPSAEKIAEWLEKGATRFEAVVTRAKEVDRTISLLKLGKEALTTAQNKEKELPQKQQEAYDLAQEVEGLVGEEEAPAPAAGPGGTPTP